MLTNKYIKIDNMVNNNVICNDDEKIDDNQQSYIKVIVDDGLRKICPWLIWIGIDLKYYSHKNDCKNFEGLFEIAKKENRLIFTVNKHMVIRSNCPRYVLFDAKLSPKQCFKYIVQYLKINVKLTKQDCHNKAVNILLCWICMKKLDQVINIKDINFDLINEHDLNVFTQNKKRIDIKWHHCTKCHRLVFFKKEVIGRKLQSSIDMFYQHVQNINHITKESMISSKVIYDNNYNKSNHNNSKHKKISMPQDIESDEKKGELDHSLVIIDEEVFPSLDVSELRHNLQLKSVYSSFYGNEPSTTNHTKQFSGCLDYVFVANVNEIINVDNIKQYNDSQYLPNKTHPSDHIPLHLTLNL